MLMLAALLLGTALASTASARRMLQADPNMGPVAEPSAVNCTAGPLDDRDWNGGYGACCTYTTDNAGWCSSDGACRPCQSSCAEECSGGMGPSFERWDPEMGEARQRGTFSCAAGKWVRVKFTQFGRYYAVKPGEAAGLRIVAGSSAKAGRRQGTIPRGDHDESGDPVVLALTFSGMLIHSSDGSALQYRVLRGVPIEIKSAHVAIQVYDGGRTYGNGGDVRIALQCFPRAAEPVGDCRAGSVRHLPWLEAITSRYDFVSAPEPQAPAPPRSIIVDNSGQEVLVAHSDEIPKLSPSLLATCERCEENVANLCQGEHGCAPGATGGLCEKCACDTTTFSKCYGRSAGGSGCEECWNDTQWLETLLTIVFCLGMCVLVPLVIWAMSKHEDKTVYNVYSKVKTYYKAGQAASALANRSGVSAASTTVPTERPPATSNPVATPTTTAAAGAAKAATSPALPAVQMLATLLPHLQICTLSFAVDMQWPEFVTKFAGWVRSIALFDYMPFLQNPVCQGWRDLKRQSSTCDLTSIPMPDNGDGTGVCVLASPLDYNVEVPNSLAERMAEAGYYWTDYGRAPVISTCEICCGTDPNGRCLYCFEPCASTKGNGYRWSECDYIDTRVSHNDTHAEYTGHSYTSDDCNITQSPDLIPTQYDMAVDAARCFTSYDCYTSPTLLADITSGLQQDPTMQTIFRVATNFGGFVVIGCVFLLVVYLPAGCLPEKCYARFGSSRKEVRQHCVNALAAAYSLLVMLVCKACFVLTDVHECTQVATSNESVVTTGVSHPCTETEGGERAKYFLAQFPKLSDTSSPREMFFTIYLGWMAFGLLVVSPSLFYLRRLHHAEGLVAEWKAIDRKLEFSRLLLDLKSVPSVLDDEGASPDRAPELDASIELREHNAFTEKELRHKTVDELRQLCTDEARIAQGDIDAADRDAVIIVCTERWSEGFQRSFGFLFLRYDPWAWWYEAAATTRKVLLVGFIELLSSRQILYALISMTAVVNALRIQLKYKPFIDGQHEFTDTLSESHARKIEGEAKPNACTCRSVGKLLLGAVVGIAGGIVLPMSIIDDQIRPTKDKRFLQVFFTGFLGPMLCCVIALMAHVGMYCCYKLVSLCCFRCCCSCCCCASPKPSQYEIVIDEEVKICVRNTSAATTLENGTVATMTSTPVVWRRHKNEHTGEDDADADPADTLEQVALVSMLILLLMGLATYLANSLTPAHKGGPPTAVDVASWMFSTVALVATTLPFVASYWLCKRPEDTRIAQVLAPIDSWLAPLDRVHQKLAASMAPCKCSRRLPDEDRSIHARVRQRSEPQPQHVDGGSSVPVATTSPPTEAAQRAANP